MTMHALVPVPVALPLLVAALLAAVGRWIPRWLADTLAIATAGGAGVASAALAWASSAGPIAYWFGGFRPEHGVAIGIPFVVEPLGAGLAATTGALACAGLVFSIEYFDTYESHFHVLILVFVAAIAGFSMTADVFDMFVFFELLTASGIALTGYKSRERGPIEGAIAFGVTETVALFLLLAGIALLYARTGSLDMAEIGRKLGAADALVVVAFAMMTGGLFVKAAVVPFHFWLADVHAVAPTPASVLFSGVMVPAALLGVARLYGDVFRGALLPHEPALRVVLLAAGALTAVLGGVMCILQRHMKRLLAFSTVSHVGVVLLGVGLLDGDALGGAAVYVVGHAFAKGALFLGVGAVLHGLESVDEVHLHGRGRKIRALAIPFFVGALALAGSTPFGTARGEGAIDEAAERLGHGWIRLPALVAAALTCAAVARAALRVFFGVGSAEPTGPEVGGETTEAPETHPSPSSVPAVMWAPAVVLLAASAACGLAPSLARAARTSGLEALDAARIASFTLDGGAPPHALVAHASSLPFAHGVAAIAIAAVVAALALRARPAPDRPSAPRRAVRAVLTVLRRAQSGRATDYVVWVVCGSAALAVACLVACVA